jgi:hypothetical protein
LSVVSAFAELGMSTTGDLAKGLNVDRAKVAAARSHIANAGATAKDHTAR